jgi:hypothetical protein
MPAKLERCVGEVRGKGGAVDPWAVCEEGVMGKGKGKGKSKGKGKGKRNPADQSAAMYSSFHGKPSTEVVEVAEQEHYHGNLAELGVLVELGVETVNGYEVWLGFDAESEGADAGSNPRRKRNAIWPFGPGQPLGTKTTVHHVGKHGHSTTASSKGLYKGHMIYGTGQGFTVPSIDRESTFDTKKDARKFVDAWTRKNGRKRNAGPIGDAIGSVEQIGGWADKELGKAIGYRRNGKDPSQMTAGELNKELDRLDKINSQLMHEMVAAGRGNERPSEYLKMDDPLANKLRAEYQKRMQIRNEMERRYGPGAPSRLPKGFGPIRRNPNSPDAISTSTVLLTSNESGTQLYFVGGDQSLDLDALKLSEHEQSKELIVIGDCFFISYMTEKEFDGFEQIVYEHSLSEDSGGPLPVLLYDRTNKRLQLAGGQYHIEQPLLTTSPGIED